MARFDHPILDELVSILPRPDRFVLNCGASMVVRGMRPEHENGDIDGATDLQTIHHCARVLGWQVVNRVVEVSHTGKPLQYNLGVVSPDQRYEFFRNGIVTTTCPMYSVQFVSLEEQKTLSEQDENTGIYIASPRLIRMFKEHTDRETDREDIRILHGYR